MARLVHYYTHPGHRFSRASRAATAALDRVEGSEHEQGGGHDG